MQRPGRRRGLQHLILLVIVLACGSLSRWGSAEESPVTGEWEHMLRGIALWSTHDAQLSYEDPPLADALTTAAVARDHGLPDVTLDPSWGGDLDVTAMTRRLARKHYAQGRETLMRARAAATWWLWAAVIYVYAWSLRLYGWPTAIAAATLVGFSPLALAYAGYLGEALPSAVTMLVVVGELARHAVGDGGRRTGWGTLPVALGVAVLTSHRAWMLLPMVATVIVVVAWRRRIPGRTIRTLAHAAAHVLGIATIVGVLVNLGFGAAHTGMSVDAVLQRPEPRTVAGRKHPHELLELGTPLPLWPKAVPIMLPYTEIFGLGKAIAHRRDGDTRAYYRGRKNRRGHWLFFPALLVLKTPLVVLALLLGGAVRSVLRAAWNRAAGKRAAGERAAGERAATVVASVTVACLLVAMRFQLNLGVDRVLHIALLSCVLAAIVLGRAWSGRGRLARVALAAVLVAAVATGVLAGPRHRGYFNVLVGRADGPELSAVGDDGGQDLTTFAREVRQRGLRPLYVHPGSWVATRELDHLGVSRKRLRCKTKPKPGAYVAVHRWRLQTAPSRCFRWARNLTPTWVVGDHLAVFEIP